MNKRITPVKCHNKKLLLKKILRLLCCKIQ